MSKFSSRFLGTISVLTFLLVLMSGNARAATANVRIEDYDFNDAVTHTSTTNINVGDTVAWHWSASDHSTTSGACSTDGSSGGYDGGYNGGSCTPDGLWDSNLAPSGTDFSQTFSTAGTFKYYCKNHLGMMTGKVVVSAVAPPPPPSGPTTCTPDAVTLCIDNVPGDKRFKIQVQFATAQGGGQSGDGKSIPLTNLGVTEGGLFWFFSANNPELLIKIVNGCVVNQHWWVFASAGTNVGVTITVTDTSDGSVKTYVNPDQTPMAPVQDPAAFSNCQ